MFFLKNKKHKKIFNAIWTGVALLVAASMILLYLPIFA